MRTTIRLNDDLLGEAKAHAARKGCTLTAFIEDAVRSALADATVRQKQGPPKFPTFKGTGLRPGVDLDDSAALLDLMEEE